MAFRQLVLCLALGFAAAQEAAKTDVVTTDSKAVKAKFLDHYSAAPDLSKELKEATKDSPDSVLHQLKNEYIPGKNGPVFETPAPGDDMGQSYVDTGRGASILAFFFFGMVILVTWLECKAWCKTITVFAELTSYDISKTEEIVPRVAEAQADVVMNKEFPIPGDVIRAFPPSVKLIAEAGTGYNNIDIEACREKGIGLCNVPEYTTEAMGDYAITLVLALSCSLAPQMKALAKGDRTYMHQCHLGNLHHFEIGGKTFGIIGGLGYIAQNISKKALAMGMRVVVSDVPSTPLGMRDSGVEVVSFDDLLAQSDFISTMVPLNKFTKGLLNEAAFDKMKPSAYVINTARGPIIDQAALIDALRKKKIAGAALDVFGEGSAPPPPLPDDSPLYDVFAEFDNVILTPHIGWQRIEARQRVVDMCGDNLAKFARGEPMNINMETGMPIR